MADFYGTVVSDKSISVPASAGETVLSVIRRAGISFASPCGGNGTCGKCKARVLGNVSPAGAEELAFLTEQERKNGVRLTCMCRAEGDFTFFAGRDDLLVMTDFTSVDYTASPLVNAMREGNKTVFTYEGEIVDTAAQDAKSLGLAVDIGTTTVALYLCDMEKGAVLATCGFPNPQRVYGADVISRMDKIMKEPTLLFEEKDVLLRALRREAEVLCERLSLSFSDIRGAVLCGNTVMEHIAAGIDPSPIGVAPFTAPTLFGTVLQNREVGLLISPDAPVYFAPCFASYVGGDIACGILATGLDKPSRNVLFLDVGTNGEIGLSTEKGLYFCSAAAGPAFEGAHIKCGMSGVAGAISQVLVDGNGIEYRTVDGGLPVGICGSGILDAVAVMLETGLLDETGRIVDEDEAGDFASYLGEDENGDAVFVLDKEQEIVLTGKDIREIQLAKAAIAAGIDTLLHKAGLAPKDITSVVLAGGFGSHMNPASACRIGMLPEGITCPILTAGNTAGAGAVAILLGEEPRKAAGTVRQNAHYTELSGDAYFMERFIDEMLFSS